MLLFLCLREQFRAVLLSVTFPSPPAAGSAALRLAAAC